MFVVLNRKKDCVVKIKISLFIITKKNISLLNCDYVIINLPNSQSCESRKVKNIVPNV